MCFVMMLSSWPYKDMLVNIKIRESVCEKNIKNLHISLNNLKGLIQPQIKMLSLFIIIIIILGYLFQTCMHFLLLWTEKKISWRMWGPENIW